MSQKRFTHLAISNTHKTLTNNVVIVDVFSHPGTETENVTLAYSRNKISVII